MAQDEFVIEEADDRTILVRHQIDGVGYLLVIKGRSFSDLAENEPNPCDVSLRSQARSFALQEARSRGWVD